MTRPETVKGIKSQVLKDGELDIDMLIMVLAELKDRADDNSVAVKAVGAHAGYY